ncbi:MAG: hypothetical protein ACTS4W_00470 [Candidatus Hodgkinia cicadicola]
MRSHPEEIFTPSEVVLEEWFYCEKCFDLLVNLNLNGRGIIFRY